MIATLQKFVAQNRMHEKRSTPAGQITCSWIFLRICLEKIKLNFMPKVLFHFSQILNKTDSSKNILLIVFRNWWKSTEYFHKLFWLRFQVQIYRLAEAKFSQCFLRYLIFHVLSTWFHMREHFYLWSYWQCGDDCSWQWHQSILF